MYDIRAERSAGWSGLAFVVLIIIATLLAGPPPASGASPAAITAFLNAHHQGILVQAWLGFPITAVFLWFAVGVRAHLAHSSGVGDGLPLYAILAAVTIVALELTGSALQTVMVTTAIPADDLPVWWALNMALIGPFVSMATAIFVFAVAASQVRHRSASQALALFGYLTAFGAAVASLSMFFNSGPMSATGWVTLVLGALLLAIWLIATSIWLIRMPVPAAP